MKIKKSHKKKRNIKNKKINILNKDQIEEEKKILNQQKLEISKKEIKKEDYIKEQRIEGSLNYLPRWKSKKIDEQLEKAICRIKIYVKEIEKLKFGTGFLCKIPNPDEFVLLPVLITNNHIIDEKKYKENREIEITFDDEKRTKKINTDLQRKFYTSEIYDITIIEILPNIDVYIIS